MITKRLIAEEKGLALVPTVFLVMLIFVLVITAFGLAATETQISVNQQRATEALYLAEAGIQMALHQLERKPNWNSGYRNYQLGSGRIKEVTVQNNLHNVRIESQGEIEGMGKRVRVELAKTSVPFANALETGKLELNPGAFLAIKGKAIHEGDLHLATMAELESHMVVAGSAWIDKATVKGSLTATGPITVQPDAIIEGDLVSTQGIQCAENQENNNLFPDVPVLRPISSLNPSFSWYQSKNHLLVEENFLLLEELGSGIYYVPGDLRLTTDDLAKGYLGQLALVVEGTAYITCNLIATNPKQGALIILAEDIVISPGVTEIWAALIGMNSVQIQNSTLEREFFGTIKAPQVLFPAGSTKLTYYPIPGVHLVRNPQTLFKIVKWLEIMVL